jgi:hypothetical protein
MSACKNILGEKTENTQEKQEKTIGARNKKRGAITKKGKTLGARRKKNAGQEKNRKKHSRSNKKNHTKQPKVCSTTNKIKKKTPPPPTKKTPQGSKLISTDSPREFRYWSKLVHY